MALKAKRPIPMGRDLLLRRTSLCPSSSTTNTAWCEVLSQNNSDTMVMYDPMYLSTDPKSGTLVKLGQVNESEFRIEVNIFHVLVKTIHMYKIDQAKPTALSTKGRTNNTQ